MLGGRGITVLLVKHLILKYIAQCIVGRKVC